MKAILKISSLFVLVVLLPISLVAQDKIGYVNVKEVLEAMPEFSVAKDSLERYMDMISHKRTELELEYNKRHQDYLLALKDSTYNKRDCHIDIADLEKRMEELGSSIGEQILAKRDELMSLLKGKINEAIQIIAQKYGYTYVFDSGDMKFLVAPEGTDITPLVKQELGTRK